MINSNGNIIKKSQASISINNRGFTYGDSVFETIKVLQNKVLFLEDHYFRLMASLRILRMEIPMNFTMEYFENEILKLIKISNLNSLSVRVKFIVYRSEGGLFTPETNAIEYFVIAEQLYTELYEISNENYTVDLYKDNYTSPGLISTLKTNNRIINVVGSIYAKENNFNNCLILNTNKHIVEALNANIFLVKDKSIKTPPLQDGCIKGIMRKQIIEIVKLLPEYTIEESSISPFELQKADELFLTNVISGIQPITQYRRKRFSKEVSKKILTELNLKVKLF
ncbi:MAG: aminotransferase class IV family protein [Bacteroidetes bacterium]|nr:aminotransferase class IV family protein [Bacteroidota bacterium]